MFIKMRSPHTTKTLVKNFAYLGLPKKDVEEVMEKYKTY